MIIDILKIFKKYLYLLQNMISRDLKVKYRRSVFGVLWSVLNPILMMLVINAVFSRIFRYEIPNFPVYLISGQTLFAFVTESTSGAMYSVVESAQLIKKVYVPKYIFPLEKVLFGFVNLLFSLSALVVIMIMFKIPVTLTTPLFVLPLILLFFFSLGMSLILSTTCVFFRDIKHLYSVLTTAWMYMTPIFYPINAIGTSGIVYWAVRLNPITWYIEYFRDVVLYGTFPSLAQNLVCLAWAAGTVVIGLWFFHRNQDKFILHI